MGGLELAQVSLPTGVDLRVAIAGSPKRPSMILLHGFPESHRTWRHQIAAFAEDHFVLAPDQRGFGGSSKPAGASNYAPSLAVGDLIAMADHFELSRFTLVGHDWGGAIAWAAALKHPDRVERLIIVNAPHPYIFQKSLFDDLRQRAASQYIRDYRDPAFEAKVEKIGLSKFFDEHFHHYADFEKARDEKPIYLEQWSQPGALTAMLNWYRATPVKVPAMDAAPERPTYLDAPFPRIETPTLVIWGLGDRALLPQQLHGLEPLVPDLTVTRLDGVGHFAPWEAPDEVTGAMREWLQARSGSGQAPR